MLLDPSALISLDSGQAFRWKTNGDGVWRGVIGDCLWTLEPEVLADISPKTPLYDFFNMGLDWSGICNRLLGIDPYLDSAISEFSGLRILRQGHFETLISFIISAFNNIGRISGIIERLCMRFGKPIERFFPSKPSDSAVFRSFPGPSDLDGITEKDLECCRMGFRAEYVVDAVRKVNSGEVDINAIQDMPFKQAKKELMRIKGVGDKVASCVLLFSYSFFEAFPKDVWIKRVLADKVGGKSESDFGEYAGVAQQFLFMKVRNESNGRKIQK